MKIGIRKPSLKKSFKARTTGKLKRSIKKAIIPGYGKKGMGWLRNPKKAAYNKIYHKTTFGVNDIVRAAVGTSSKSQNRTTYNRSNNSNYNNYLYLLEKVKNMENMLGINTKAKNTPQYCILGGLLCVIFGTVIIPLILIGFILEIIGLVLMCKKKYWNAYRWNKAIVMFLNKDYTKSKKYLDKLSNSEKETLAYEKMQQMLNGNDDVKDSIYESESECSDEYNIKNIVSDKKERMKD